jgi:hypothetical protein
VASAPKRTSARVKLPEIPEMRGGEPDHKAIDQWRAAHYRFAGLTPPDEAERQQRQAERDAAHAGQLEAKVRSGLASLTELREYHKDDAAPADATLDAYKRGYEQVVERLMTTGLSGWE